MGTHFHLSAVVARKIAAPDIPKILEKGKVIKVAENFVEKVRESERAALDMKKDAQNAARLMLDDARRQGEQMLLKAEREAASYLAKSAAEDLAAANARLSSEEDKADGDALMIQKQAESRMGDAIALILERVGDVWQ